jgi:hypothetical protein
MNSASAGKKKPMSPAKYVISQFGGVNKTANAIGRDPSSVCRWKHNIPPKLYRRILNMAKRKNLDITEKDLIFGR